ncbi:MULTISPECIES: PTS transporter subunit EIIB [Glaesserella]|uniref:PTS sugar transporter subunit IIB n=1 Tax=Glaesserella australis TaxID=2094024 RepID=A0A328C091_9PAST|nr:MULTISPECIES: PTS transporter subunit EIIB [Glaesserella]AUI66723.1 PTS sugar transporter subunit IIB [Glaesserella sp. 15-184]RAL17884.1 PTS sugar transporter subunit IIB [Glaesserella australis]
MSEHINKIVNALGSIENIISAEACMTRLRVAVKDLNQINKSTLIELGALDVLEVNQNIHIILGTKASQYRDEINQILVK